MKFIKYIKSKRPHYNGPEKVKLLAKASMYWPILARASSLWDLHPNKNIQEIEYVQNSATLRFRSNLKDHESVQMLALDLLNLQTPEEQPKYSAQSHLLL